MRTANPALNDAAFRSESYDSPRSQTMTVNGAVLKTGILTALLLAAAGVSWSIVFPNGVGDGMSVNRPAMLMSIFGGLIVGFIASLVICFSPKTSPYVAPIYAVAEGALLGAFSGFFEGQYQGMVLQAGLLTVGVLVTMLLAYTSGLIRATEKFKMGVIAATGAICLVYLATIVLSLFGIAVPYIHAAGPIGIGFSVIVVVIAALNLILDFDVIESGARANAPKYMEWYGAFGLMVTLVWLYIEILRLLLKLRNSD